MFDKMPERDILPSFQEFLHRFNKQRENPESANTRLIIRTLRILYVSSGRGGGLWPGYQVF